MRYAVTLTREGRFWVADVDGVGVTQGRNIAEAERMSKDLVQVLAKDLHPTLAITFRGTLCERAAALQLEQRHIEELVGAAGRSSRGLVRQMRKQGLSGADIAKVMGLSPQRVSQLSQSQPKRVIRKNVSLKGR